jgi:DMSO/TMAO reductase YedYZ molybdopterin-dependent catalytic subunit
MDDHDLLDERGYDRARLADWRTGRVADSRFTRRDLARLAAGLSMAAGGSALIAAPARAEPAPGPIVKPLPPDLFHLYGSNAEMRWEAMAGQDYLVPVDRFFVRNHTRTPLVNADTWRLRLFGTGLRGSPTAHAPIEFSYQDLLDMPAKSLTASIECAGNGRGFFASQQQQTVSGTPWRLGAVGVARWRGVRLATVLRRAGLTRGAVDVMPQGLDDDFVTGGVNLGPVRRPLPVAKAIHDALLVYEMNGQPLPPDHGFPARLVVPSWVGISSIKWVGQIEVSAAPLFSPWNTQFYRLFGPDYPAEGTPVDRQVVKSAFELAWNASLPAGRTHLLRGRSWSGNGHIRRVEVSTDDGATWGRARPVGAQTGQGWQRWEFRWRPPAAGLYTLRARATDVTGATQPARTPYNTLGYLFGAIVAHPVSVT